jgi:hypothetical protein
MNAALKMELRSEKKKTESREEKKLRRCTLSEYHP